MRTALSVTSLLISITLITWLVFKAGIATLTYIVGFAIAIFMAFMSGMAIKQVEENPTLNAAYDKLKTRYETLKEEFEKGRAAGPNTAVQD